MISTFYNQSFIDIRHYDRSALMSLIELTHRFKTGHAPKHCLNNKVIASCFFEPSTRTRLSFESAICRLGGQIIGFDSIQNTSSTKGETLSDTIRMLSSYSDAIIMRHPNNGAAEIATQHSGSIPIINAGDGSNQHPSQTLLDLYTIYEVQKRLDNLTVTFVGDLKYGRTVHSLALALSLFDNITIQWLSPPSLTISSEFSAQLEKTGGITHKVIHSLTEAIANSDILYMTRLQKERMTEDDLQQDTSFILTSSLLYKAPETLKILHPLPRVNEISSDVDFLPQAYYFEQAKNGVYARQALMCAILSPASL